MLRFVEHYLELARQDQCHCDAEAFVLGLAPNLDPVVVQVLDGDADVVAHESQLMTDAAVEGRSFGRVDPEFFWRKGNNEPPVAIINALPTENISEDAAHRLGLRRVEKRMNPGDGHTALSRMPTPFVSDYSTVTGVRSSCGPSTKSSEAMAQ